MDNRCFLKIEKWKFLLCLISGIIYFVLLFRFYMIDYNVPDFRLYESFYESKYLAKDGFSTLFIWIAHFAKLYPHRLTVFCLVLLTFAFVNMLLGVSLLYGDTLFKWLIGISFSMVCGCWYYFYGKIFYDFPFSAYFYSIGFILVIDLLKKLESNTADEKRVNIEWFIIMVVFGFMMTWKPYNIFPVVGLWLLSINNKACSDFFWGIVKKPAKFFLTFALFMVGYFVGNYGLLFNPKETMCGIRAYAANSDFIDFMFNGKEQIWDHVNSVSFNQGIITVVSLGLVLFAVPLILKKWTYLCISFVMFLGYVLYIYECSPGYLWHGLPLGLFIISYAIFMIREIDDGRLSELAKKSAYGVFTIAILYQGFNCFAKYIPKQINWHNNTEEAINVLENNYEDIASVIEKYSEQLLSAGYSVTYDNAVKRYRPCNYNGGIKFVDPLEYMIINNEADKAWITDIREVCDTDYVIYVVPDAMIKIDDIACSRKYDNDNVVDVVLGDGYEIRLIQSSLRYILN